MTMHKLTAYSNNSRTHARGSGMAKLDPEAETERARRQKRAEETQRINEMQVRGHMCFVFCCIAGDFGH